MIKRNWKEVIKNIEIDISTGFSNKDLADKYKTTISNMKDVMRRYHLKRDKSKLNIKEIEYKYLTNNSGIGDCIICTSHSTNSKWYPHIRRNGKKYTLHRYVWEESFGNIEKGMVVRHKCDNPKCCNIDHLELGTQKDNCNDRVLRNRQAKGSRNGASKLEEDQVLEIKNLVKIGISVTKIARKFNVLKTTISSIKHKRNWGWLE